ncbi:MAG: NrfD/PsrC family molybdoenzyme membrane anchor subunit [bacterium]|nr:NrfD/PsrC family molybdoenzyme membrane anchor subunit [bacterium]
MKKKTLRLLSRLWAAAFLLGLAALVAKFATGERLAGYGSYVPWGLWVALYFHFVGIAGGVFVAGMTGYFLGLPHFREHLRVIMLVSTVAVVTGLFSIWLDLGQPFRAYRMIFAPNFGSMMAFNAWMYSFFLAVVAVCFHLSYQKASQEDVNDRSGWLAPLLMAALLLSIAYPSQSGAFFGVVDAKPFWSSALLPILFLGSAVTSGAAVLLLLFTFLLREEADIRQQPLRLLRRMTLGGMAFYFLAEFAEYSIVYWSPISHNREAVDLVIFGPFWWVFWLVHLGGALVAAFLMMRGRSLPAVGTGAFLVAVTFVSARLNILIPGQAVAELKGLNEAYTHVRLSHHYQATWNEYLVALFIGAFGVGLVVLGLKLLARHSMKKIGAAL